MIRVLFAVALLAPSIAYAQGFLHRHHPPQDIPIHERFYRGWFMPDDPAKSCCNAADCYPTVIEYRNREDLRTAP